MKKQLIPISISLTLFVIFSFITYFLLFGLNQFDVIKEKMRLEIIWPELLIGIGIYLKTAVDYALFVGMLMEKNQGIPKRIAMNVGTSIGCFLGVTIIVILWSFFKEIHWLMAILLIIAASVLFSLGDASQEHFESINKKLRYPLELFFKLVRPIVEKITFFMPEGGIEAKALNIKKLFILSAIIPFALGADDLAGYMTLLTPITAFSILIGIYFGDAIIDIALFANHKLTVKIVKNRWISYIGTLFFIGLGLMSIIHAVTLFI